MTLSIRGNYAAAIFPAILAAAAAALPSVAQLPAGPELQKVTADTPLQADDPVERVARMYRDFKQMQYDGAEPDAVYTSAYDIFSEAYPLLASDPADEAADQLRGIMHEINMTLAKGAVSYSSRGDSKHTADFAKAYVDIHLMPEMATVQLPKDPQLYPALVYTAASSSYNQGDLDNAIRYFEEYIATGDQAHHETVCLFYGQSLLKTGQPARGLKTLTDASHRYGANRQLLTIAMQMCIDTGERNLLEPLLDRALIFTPDDEKLLILYAQLREWRSDFRGALDTYNRLDELHPDNLEINEGLARCYYNLGTGYYNESITATNDKDAARCRRQSNAYFSNAAEKYEVLSDHDPNNTGYLKAMGTAYACLGNKSKVDAINIRLTALGQLALAMNTMPAIIGDAKGDETVQARNIPSYQEYAKDYVTSEIAKWARRGEFEKVDDYTKRMSQQSIAAEQKRLSDITAERYLKEYASHLVLSELNLQPYDVEHETYAIHSDFGPVYIKVPLKNREAELFKSNWEKVQIKNTKFFIKDDAIAISTITFHTPNGRDYTYNESAALSYEPPVVNVDPTVLMQNNSDLASSVKSNSSPAKGANAKRITVESDVDKDIPQTRGVNSNTVALVIANENYTRVPAVTSAEHDGDVVAQYFERTLGIPAQQILHYKDATFGNMLSAVNRLKNTVAAMGPETTVIFYYAGHGVPDEATKDAYLLPVDADPQVMATAYSLDRLYNDLESTGAETTVVLMDACFSGANRGEGMLADARAVVLKPKALSPKGNMAVLSAADGNETALPWKEKNHGLFTYWLLKKLQESKGNASLQEIADFVTDGVRKTSSLELGKPQTPKLTVSGVLASQLAKKKLK